MNKIDLCQKALDFKAISDLSDLPKVENVCVSVKADKLEMLLLYGCTSKRLTVMQNLVLGSH